MGVWQEHRQRSQVSFVRNYTRDAFTYDENIGISLKSCGVRLHTGNAWRWTITYAKVTSLICKKLYKECI